MTSTASLVKSFLKTDSKFWKRGGMEYLGPSPLRDSSDSRGFHLTIDGDEYGRWKDFVSDEKGTLYELADKLGITPPRKRVSGKQTLDIRSLADYEKSLGFEEGYLLSKRWEEGTHQNRPCIFIPLDDGTRQVRYLDGEKPKWKPEANQLERESDGGAKLSFYGSGKAKLMRAEKQLNFLVWVNGASSVEAMQAKGVPAFAVVGGENNMPRKVYTDRVLKSFSGMVLIALDCDKAGREGAEKLVKLLGDRGLVIDLGGTEGFDAADFCSLWGAQSLARLRMLANEADSKRPPRTASEAAQAVLGQIEGKRKLRGRLIPQPFKSLHHFGGGAYILEPDLVTGVMAVSGHGKTAWWQSWVKELLSSPRQFGIMVDSREFTPEADSIRRMQGELKNSQFKINSDIIKSHLVYQQEEEEGIAPEYRFGKPMRPELIEEIKQITAFMQMDWKGTLEFAEEHSHIEDTLDYMKRRTLEIREDGGRMDLWVFDYLTLYRCYPAMLEGVGKNLYGVITQAIKDAAREMHVHVILMLQPNKSPASDAVGRNERLKITDMAYVNENDFNFVLALNVLYGTQAAWEKFDNAPQGRWVVADYDPATGNPLIDKALLKDGTVAAVVEVLKNTHGVKGMAYLRADFANIQWLDSTWTNADLRLPLDAGFRD